MGGIGKRFEKGNKLSKGRPKGSVSKKKIIWNNLGKALEKEGAEKFLRELNKLQGEKYVKHYLAAMEYFKPKHPRLTIKKEDKTILKLSIERTIVEKPKEVKAEIKLLDNGETES
jgi:hypothetical protein